MQGILQNFNQISASTFPTSNTGSQTGLSVYWNHSSGNGETDFVNSAQGGGGAGPPFTGGGYYFYDTNAWNAPALRATINYAGFTTSANVNCANVSASGLITATGNVNCASLIASGNVNCANLSVSSGFTTSGNLNCVALNTTGLITTNPSTSLTYSTSSIGYVYQLNWSGPTAMTSGTGYQTTNLNISACGVYQFSGNFKINNSSATNTATNANISSSIWLNSSTITGTNNNFIVSTIPVSSSQTFPAQSWTVIISNTTSFLQISISATWSGSPSLGFYSAYLQCVKIA